MQKVSGVTTNPRGPDVPSPADRQARFRHLLSGRRWQAVWQRAMELALPWQCPLCGERENRGDETFCDDCLTQLHPPGNCCGRCGAIMGPYASPTKNCPHCRRRPYRFRAARCLNMYDGVLKTVIIRSKSSYSSAPLVGLGRLLIAVQQAWLTQIEVDCILPIPQSWLTRLRRNFNPADILAGCVGRQLGVTVDRHLLCRRGLRPPQKRVSLQQRYRNQSNAFRLQDARQIRGQRVLLVDDVLTTGATCSEAARLLKAAGAKDVFVLVAARVADQR